MGYFSLCISFNSFGIFLFLEVFKDIEHVRVWMVGFVNWYNVECRHSAIGYVTPAQRKKGDYKEIFKRRNDIMKDARLSYLERWGNRIRVWKANEETSLNPSDETKERLNQKVQYKMRQLC